MFQHIKLFSDAQEFGVSEANYRKSHYIKQTRLCVEAQDRGEEGKKGH